MKGNIVSTRASKINLLINTLHRIRVYTSNGYRVEWDGDEVTGVGFNDDVTEAWIEHGPTSKTIMMSDDGSEDLADVNTFRELSTRFKVMKQIQFLGAQ